MTELPAGWTSTEVSSEDGKEWAITNSAPQPRDLEPINVTKEWSDVDQSYAVEFELCYTIERDPGLYSLNQGMNPRPGRGEVPAEPVIETGCAAPIVLDGSEGWAGSWDDLGIELYGDDEITITVTEKTTLSDGWSSTSTVSEDGLDWTFVNTAPEPTEPEPTEPGPTQPVTPTPAPEKPVKPTPVADEGSLAKTGTSAGMISAASAALLIAGAGMVLAVRNRREA